MAVLALAMLAPAALAHPGALDANGCHRIRKTRVRVCHAGHIALGEHRRYVGYDGAVRHFGR